MLESRPIRPLARFDDLVINQLSNETLVYDQRTYHIHYLDEVTAATWRHSDGRHTVSDLARVVSWELARTLSIATIELALVKLSDVNLLLTPMEVTEPRASRRSLLRKAAIGGAAVVPTIVSVSAPQAAMAVSTCSGGFPVCPTDGECCVSGECDGFGNCCRFGNVCADGNCCDFGTCSGGVCVV
jgi:hypothetical protein